MNHISTLSPSISIIRPLTLRFKFSLKIFWILSALSIILFLAFYIFQANSMVSEKYLLKDYQKKLNNLSRENEFLEINSAQVNSLGNIENLVKDFGFEKVGQVHYIQVLESQVVKE